MRFRILWLAVALSGGAPGCGGSSVRSTAAGAQGGRAAALGSGGAAAGNAAVGGASSEATYAGVVLAMASQGASSDYTARAIFTQGARRVIGGCSKCCCYGTQRGLPIPVKPPDAGQITLGQAGSSNSLATLVPATFADGSGSFYGTSYLGWAWFPPLSNYAPAQSQPWNFGDSLRVVAAGNEVASFTGTLDTGPELTGVTPPIGPTAIIVDHTRPFEIGWTPAAQGDATVLLSIPGNTGLCFCDAPDSAGSLVVDASLLGPVTGEISLSRLSIVSVTSANASIDLVGAVVQNGPVEVQ